MATAQLSDTTKLRNQCLAVLRNEAERPENKAKAAARLIELDYPRLASYLPAGVDGREVLATARQAIMTNPAIATCTADSILRSVAGAMLCGLRPGYPHNECDLIPRNCKKKIMLDNQEKVFWVRECTMQPSAKGAVRLVANTGCMQRDRPPRTEVIYEGEIWSNSYDQDDNLRIEHVPDLTNKHRSTGDDKYITGVYVRWYLQREDGTKYTRDHYMSRAQIEQHRDKYAERPKYGDWNWEKEFKKMAEKTVKKQSVDRGLLPVSVAVVEAANRVEPLTEETQEPLDVLEAFAQPVIDDAPPEISHDPSAGGIEPGDAAE